MIMLRSSYGHSFSNTPDHTTRRVESEAAESVIQNLNAFQLNHDLK